MDQKQGVPENLYRKEWDAIEDEKTQPRFLREIISTTNSTWLIPKTALPGRTSDLCLLTHLRKMETLTNL